MRLITNDELLVVAGGTLEDREDESFYQTDSGFASGDSSSGGGGGGGQNNGNDNTRNSASDTEKKVCADMAQKAWNFCNDHWACRNATNEKQVKQSVEQACHDSFNNAKK